MRDPVIDAKQVATLVRPRLLDVRPCSDAEASPVAGARRVPLDAWIDAARTPQGSLTNTAHWQAQLAALALTDGDTAVVFDDGGMTEAARAWFILQYFGVRTVVVNGGLPAWQRAGQNLPVVPKAPAGAALTLRAGAGPVGLVDRPTLHAGLGATAVLDARTAAEYDGTELRRNARGGHLPGARLVPHADLLDQGQLRPAGALRERLAAAGFQPGDHIVTHCDGGGRAALAAIAALRAGLADVRVYYLSFSDWAQDDTCPIVR